MVEIASILTSLLLFSAAGSTNSTNQGFRWLQSAAGNRIFILAFLQTGHMHHNCRT